MDGRQASHALSIHEQGQAIGGAVDILQQIAQALQRVAQPAQVIPQRTVIERIEKYRPIDFLGKKDEQPSTSENCLKRTERMLRQMKFTLEENLECATSLIQEDAY